MICVDEQKAEIKLYSAFLFLVILLIKTYNPFCLVLK